MADETNLHLVKTELNNMNALFEHFQEIYHLHYDELSSEGEQDREKSLCLNSESKSQTGSRKPRIV